MRIPVSLLKEVTGVSKAANASASRNMTSFRRPDVYTSIIDSYCIFLKRKLLMAK